MKKYLLFLLFFSIAVKRVYPQARLVINNGGLVNITNAAFVVIDNPNPNAITRNTSGHIISEGEFNRLKWNIGTNTGTYTVPFGIGTAEYLPVSLTTSAAAGAGGSLTFAMYGGNWVNSSYLPTGITNFVNNNGSDNSAFVIDRFWRVEPQGYTTKPALSNLVFTYRDIEHSVANNFISEPNLIAQRYNTGTNAWDDYFPGTTINTTSNTATIASLPSTQLFTWWTLVDNNSVLPIELSIFNAKCDGKAVNIYWQTASENNNHHFEIERSDDGINFTSIAIVNTQNGNSNVTQHYFAKDENPLNVRSYYRLKQVDNDGKISYSSIVTLSCTATTGNSASPVVSVFPNPATDILTVDIKGMPGKKSILIYNALGQEMTDKLIIEENENTQQAINITAFAKATYIIRIDAGSELYQVIKFVKK